ncbi:MAG: hypothetical protein WAN63_04095, partial [Candidatus Sulfotelmatobacter sp.]
MARKADTRKFAAVLIMSVVSAVTLPAQSPEVHAPQTARQALLEMFSLKTPPGTFVKHLPAATQNALEKSGALKTLQEYSMLTSQFHSTGNPVETFDTGSVLLSTIDPKTGQ